MLDWSLSRDTLFSDYCYRLLGNKLKANSVISIATMKLTNYIHCGLFGLVTSDLASPVRILALTIYKDSILGQCVNTKFCLSLPRSIIG